MAEQGAVLGQAEKRETEKHEITINPASLKKKKKTGLFIFVARVGARSCRHFIRYERGVH